MASRRRPLWVALGAVAVLLIAGLATALAIVLARPTPQPITVPSPQAATTPGSLPSASPPPAERTRESQQYRAYVSTVVQGGTAVVAGLLGLEGCRVSRDECVQRLGEARGQVQGLQQGLAATPAPPCLTDADQRLQDALSFEQTGLAMAQDGVRAQNRLHATQGLLLTGVGLWRGGQAILAGRQSTC